MTIEFQYNKEKDIWCLLNKGKSSNNSQIATKVYEQLIASHGENLTSDIVADFIQKYISEKQIDLQKCIADYQEDWNSISTEYEKRAEAVFGISLPQNMIGYLTINNRCPYSIENNYFFISVPTVSPRLTIMHELWHFYTWYSLGADQEEKLGKQKYNELKEALTVLLNMECKDLLPEDIYDDGYPQHKEMREEIVEFWSKEKNMHKLWNYLKAK